MAKENPYPSEESMLVHPPEEPWEEAFRNAFSNPVEAWDEITLLKLILPPHRERVALKRQQEQTELEGDALALDLRRLYPGDEAAVRRAYTQILAEQTPARYPGAFAALIERENARRELPDGTLTDQLNEAKLRAQTEAFNDSASYTYMPVINALPPKKFVVEKAKRGGGASKRSWTERDAGMDDGKIGHAR